MKKLLLAAFLAVTAFVGGAAYATDITPSFAGAPSGWSTDRYAPDVFQDIGSYKGHINVLYINSGDDEALINRPAPYQSTFYNTQGDAHSITGGAGDSISASLYIPQTWATIGLNQTDMWGVLTDASDAISGYPIIGFTDVGGLGHFQAWDDTNGVWVPLADTVNYNAWNDLSIVFTGSEYDFMVNGNLAWADTGVNGSTNFSSIIMQIHNLDVPTDVQLSDPSAYWSNVQKSTPAPEPLTLSIMGAGLLGMAGVRRKRQLAA